MTPKTKAFLKELSDLLCKYDARLEHELFGVLHIVFLDKEDKDYSCAFYDSTTWQEIDRMLESCNE